MTKLEKRNKYFFGLGTVGRDMFYAFEANALLYYCLLYTSRCV